MLPEIAIGVFGSLLLFLLLLQLVLFESIVLKFKHKRNAVG